MSYLVYVTRLVPRILMWILDFFLKIRIKQLSFETRNLFAVYTFRIRSFVRMSRNYRAKISVLVSWYCYTFIAILRFSPAVSWSVGNFVF